jgi:methylmalonyl-CoA mutase cobalamin-binding domain/chain
MTQGTRLEQLSAALAELDEPRALELVDEIVANSPETAGEAVDAIQAGMDEVGRRYQDGDYFLAEMIFAAEVVRQAMPRLTAVMATGDRKSLGRVVMGTVKGDLHDIGKNLVSVMMTAAGFDVVDLGIDVTPERFVQAIKEQQPQIVGLSGLLTLSVDAMVDTVQAIQEAGLRDQVKVIIGGNPVTEHIHGVVGSDAWTNNAAEGLAICQRWAGV